jgi:hypothetical protein
MLLSGDTVVSSMIASASAERDFVASRGGRPFDVVGCCETHE